MIKTLLGKSLNDNQFQELISLEENDFKKKITDQFENNRNERIKILGDERSKEIEKNFVTVN